MKSLKFKSIVTFAIALFIFVNHANAQDKIFKKNQNTPIEAKVIEIGTGEIKYKLVPEQTNELIYVLEKIAIEKIEFENGKVEYFGVERMDMEENFLGQDRQAFKVSFLGPMIGTTKFSYEQITKPGRSWEAKASVVGLGKSYGRKGGGLFGSVGYKFYRKPTFLTSDLRRRNLMEGAYFKPEVFIGAYKGQSFDSNHETVSSGGILLNFGRQWVFGERIVLDVAYGVGYGSGESYRAYLVGENLAMAGSLNLGFTF